MAFWASPSHPQVKRHRICQASPWKRLDPVFQHGTPLSNQRTPMVDNETSDGSRILTAFPSPTPFGLG